MSGYQNDTILNADDFGNLPLDLLPTSFGITTGSSNNYSLLLDPPISAYRPGMTLQVRFHLPNTGAATLDVNNLGVIPIKKIFENDLIELEANDLQPNPIYQLSFDGINFQMTIARNLPLDNREGFWSDKGSLDPDSVARLPAAKRGDVYTISKSGVLGENFQNVGLQVAKGDVLHCLQDTNGGFYGPSAVRNSWNLIQSKIANATEVNTGVARFAKSSEIDQGSPSLMVSPATLNSSLSRFGHINFDHIQVTAPQNPSTTQEEPIPGIITVSADSIKLFEGLKIIINGVFNTSDPLQAAPVNKRLRVYLGNSIIYLSPVNTSPVGLFSLEIRLYRLNDTLATGFSTMQINAEPTEVLSLNRKNVAWTQDSEVRMTIQNQQVGQINTITRVFWRAERIL